MSYPWPRGSFLVLCVRQTALHRLCQPEGQAIPGFFRTNRQLPARTAERGLPEAGQIRALPVRADPSNCSRYVLLQERRLGNARESRRPSGNACSGKKCPARIAGREPVLNHTGLILVSNAAVGTA